MPPAPGQGALAITCRATMTAARAMLAKLAVAEFEIAMAAERGFLEALDGSCRTPIGALARSKAGSSFLGEVLTPDGKQRWRREGDSAATMDAAMMLGTKLGADIRKEAGPLYSAHFGDRGWSQSTRKCSGRRTKSGFKSLIVATPSSFMVRSTSARRISKARVTPASPAAARP